MPRKPHAAAPSPSPAEIELTAARHRITELERAQLAQLNEIGRLKAELAGAAARGQSAHLMAEHLAKSLEAERDARSEQLRLLDQAFQLVAQLSSVQIGAASK